MVLFFNAHGSGDRIFESTWFWRNSKIFVGISNELDWFLVFLLGHSIEVSPWSKTEISPRRTKFRISCATLFFSLFLHLCTNRVHNYSKLIVIKFPVKGRVNFLVASHPVWNQARLHSGLWIWIFRESLYDVSIRGEVKSFTRLQRSLYLYTKLKTKDWKKKAKYELSERKNNQRQSHKSEFNRSSYPS